MLKITPKEEIRDICNCNLLEIIVLQLVAPFLWLLIRSKRKKRSYYVFCLRGFWYYSKCHYSYTFVLPSIFIILMTDYLHQAKCRKYSWPSPILQNFLQCAFLAISVRASNTLLENILCTYSVNLFLHNFKVLAFNNLCSIIFHSKIYDGRAKCMS